MFPIDSLELTPAYGQVACEKNWRWHKLDSPLPDYDLWYVWSGKGNLELNGESYSLAKGSCFLFRKGDRVHATHDPHNPLTVSYLHFEINRKLSGALQEVPAPYRIVRDTMLLETHLSRYVKTLNERSYRYEEEAKMLLSLMLHQLLREQFEAQHTPYQDANAAVIREIANYIRQRPSIWHRIPDLAERADLSPRYFALKFKEIMNIPIETFIIQVRIKRAEHLLKNSQMRIAEVADALGYQNIYYFSRQFKKYTGRSPIQVRKG